MLPMVNYFVFEGFCMNQAFSPIQLGNLTLPNRFLMGSMHLGVEGETGVASRMATFYGKRFEGGVGMIVTGGISVNEEGKGSKSFFQFLDPNHAKELKLMNEALAGKGIMCAQLFHAGRYAFDRNCVAPSAIRAPINRYVPRALSEEECWRTIEDFGRSAKIAYEVGFGAVEIMGSEGYLLNQFFSPVTNHRNDYFGGDAKRRMNFSIEVLRIVKKNLPEGFPVIFRMSGIDLIPGNPSFEDVILLSNALRDQKASGLNIGIGWHESRVPTISQLVPRGAWVPIARRIKEHTEGIPIIASNRVNDAETIKKVFSEQSVDMISMARPFLADPYIIKKLQTNESNRINTCVACNQACLDHAFQEKHVSCIVNPMAMNEEKYHQNKTTNPKKVLVIGTGPAGLEAARAAKELGHNVTLFEKRDQIGGQFQLASHIPGKSEFNETIRFFQNELKSIGVKTLLNTEAKLDNIQSENADVVIFASGVIPRGFQIKGLDLIPHGSYADYLTGKFIPGKQVAVIGGGGIGVDVAHRLTEEHDPTLESYQRKYNISSFTNAVVQTEISNRKVAVFRRNGKHGAGLGPTTFWALKQELESVGVEFYQGLSYKEVTKEGLVVVFKNGEEFLYPCDSIILCVGQEKEDSLYEEFTKTYPNKKAILIGGAKDAKNIDAKRAFFEGLDAAYSI